MLFPLFVAIAAALVVAIYASGFAKTKKGPGLIDFSQLLVLIIPTIIFILFFVGIPLLLASNPRIDLTPIPDNLFLFLFALFLTFGGLGNGIHFTGKCLNNYLKKSKDSNIRKAGFFFHIRFGHHMVYAFTFLLMALMVLFEYHHPSVNSLKNLDIILLISSGILSGLTWGVAISISLIGRRYYIILGALLFIFLSIFKLSSSISYSILPYSLFLLSSFVITVLFLITDSLLGLKGKRLIEFFLSRKYLTEWRKDKLSADSLRAKSLSKTL